MISFETRLPKIALIELSNSTDNIETDNTSTVYRLKSVISKIGSSSKNINTTTNTLNSNLIKFCIYNILNMSIIGIEPICFSTWRLQRHPFPFWHMPKKFVIKQITLSSIIKINKSNLISIIKSNTTTCDYIKHKPYNSRIVGIEPTSKALKAPIFPLDHTP